MAPNLVNRLWQSFLRLNLYKNHLSNEQTAPKEHLATRIYICSLTIGVFVITIVSAFIVRTVNVIEYSSSHKSFSQLVSKYPNTIYCPCSNIGVAYGTFVTTHVAFHQVCSSQFIQQEWIDIVFAEQTNKSLSSDDLRPTLSFFWQVIAGFCSISNRTWLDIEASFSASQTFNPLAIADNFVQAQVEAALNDQIDSARMTLTRNLQAIRRVTSGNQLVSALATNFYLRYPPEDLNSASTPLMSPRIYNNCSCLHSEGCPHPSTFNDSYGHLISIPGLIADCLIMDGTLASTLECYYNQSCISLLHPSLSIVIQPLSHDLNNYFTMNSTVEMLLNKIMIDNIINDINFDLFYSQCNPAYCSYSYAHRFDAWFIITTNIGIIGGLSFVLKMIAPFIATVILKWKNRNRSKNSMPHINVPQQRRFSVYVVFNHLRLLPNYIQHAILNLNLFESETPRTPTNIFREQLLTRLFIVLMTISSIAAGFYTFLVVENQVVTIAHPSLVTYQQLYNDYSDTLQCPCSQLSVPYETFLNVTFVLHQVCSSDFVSSTWLAYLESFDPIFLPSWTVVIWARDFRTTGNSYFQLLTAFCSLTKNTIEDSQYLFNNTLFINDHVLALPLFTEQTQAILESYITNMQNDFPRAINSIMVTFAGNYFLTGANTNFVITVNDDDTVTIGNRIFFPHIMRENELIGTGGECECPIDSLLCFPPDLLYTNGSTVYQYEQNFKEIPIGCTPLIGFLQSTFTWWYDDTYLKNIQETYARVIYSQPPPNMKPLNSSVSTRFGSEQLGTLLNEMFLEMAISNETHFDQFYSQCAPISCSYTIVQRRDLIVVLFLLISICSGLNKILRILLRAFVKLIFFLIDWWKTRDIQQPLPSITAYLRHLFKFIYKSIVDINLYKTISTDEIDLRQQRIYTRIYIVSFVSCLSVLLFYTAIIERSITKTHAMSSINDYEYLLDLYSDNLNCPCKRISIPYSEFITELQVNAFHQACSTNVIDAILTAPVPEPAGHYYVIIDDFRNFIDVFEETLQQLCTLAQETADNSITKFNSSTMFVKQIMPRVQFNNEMNTTLNQFQEKTPIEFARTINLIRTTIQGNALFAAHQTNWKLVVAEQDQESNSSFSSVPITYIDTEHNTSCSCATSQTCTIPAHIFTGDITGYYTIEGLRLACYPLQTVLLSSLSCSYSTDCIYDYWNASSQYDGVMERVHYNKSFVKPLNSTLTRFNINDTIETLAYDMFIESWITNVSYERFFNSCASNYCTYKVYYRFDALELLTTFLSVYAGLSLGIRFMVPYVVQIIKKIRNRFRVVPLQ